jgi:Tfp pilus assembly protein PilZ
MGGEMGTNQKPAELFATFDSVEAFTKAIEHQGAETGMLFRTTQPLPVGEHVWICASIEGGPQKLFLEGRVLWRRLREGGSQMPAGMFVGLMERERGHLDALFRRLQNNEAKQERRRHVRYPILLKATYETSQGLHRAETRDLSKSGAFIRCLGPLLNRGAEFPVSFIVGKERGDTITLNAGVVWMDFAGSVQGIGIVFLGDRGSLKRMTKTVDEYENRFIKR